MSWTALRITPDANRDGVIAALFASGSQGVQEDGATLVTHFPADIRVDDVRTAVLKADPHAAVSIASTPAADFSQWRANVSAHRIGNLVIAPPWLAPEFSPQSAVSPQSAAAVSPQSEVVGPQSVVVVDPAMAFGTGDHPTTRGVIELMQGVIRAGDVVADLGAGSAVLSIAAVRLGAARAAAIELDPDAIGNAEDNVRVNGVTGRVEIIEGDAAVLLPLLAPVRVVLANIIRSVLIPMLPVIRSSLHADGQAILSGILCEERGAMVDALTADWRIERELTEDDWWSVQIAPR